MSSTSVTNKTIKKALCREAIILIKNRAAIIQANEAFSTNSAERFIDQVILKTNENLLLNLTQYIHAFTRISGYI